MDYLCFSFLKNNNFHRFGLEWQLKVFFFLIYLSNKKREYNNHMILAKYKNEKVFQFSSDLKKVQLTPYQPVQYIPTWHLVGSAHPTRNLHRHLQKLG